MFKAIEVSINLSVPGATVTALQTAVAHLPDGSKFLGSCASPSSVFLFYDVPAHPGPSLP